MSSEKVKITPIHVSAARELLKITQAELAAAAGLTEQTIYSFENGRNVPRDKTLEAIRDALERRGIEFMNGDRPGVRLDRSKAIIPT